MRQRAKLLAAGWENYRSRVLSQSASEEHFRQCRRSFYAGAHFLLCDVFCRLDPAEDPTEDDLTMVEDLQEELIEFAVSVVSGRE
jgi:hypothetical protein